MDCCGLDWLFDGTLPTTTKHIKHGSYGGSLGRVRTPGSPGSARSRVSCATPLAKTNKDISRPDATINWDPNDVKDGGKICGCPTKAFPLMQNGTCVKACSPKYARRMEANIINNDCDRCRYHHDSVVDSSVVDEHCAVCSARPRPMPGFPSICGKCTDNYYLKNGQGCVSSCNNDAAENNQFGFRNVGSATSGRRCELCEDSFHTGGNCNACMVHKDTCTECNNDHHLHKGKCVHTCPFKLKVDCADGTTPRVNASNKDADYLYRWTPSGGTRDTTTNVLTGSRCTKAVEEDNTKPSASLRLSPNTAYTRDATALLLAAFGDAQSATVAGMSLEDVAFSPPNSTRFVRGAGSDVVGKVLAKDAYVQFEFLEQGAVTIELPGGVANDESCNPNTAATPITVVYDTGPPSLSITSFSTKGLVDTVFVSITDARSPVVVTVAGLKKAISISALGAGGTVPALTIEEGACKAETALTATCTLLMKHPQGVCSTTWLCTATAWR